WPPSSSAGSQSRRMYLRSREMNSSRSWLAKSASKGGAISAIRVCLSVSGIVRGFLSDDRSGLSARIGDHALYSFDTFVSEEPFRWFLRGVFPPRRESGHLEFPQFTGNDVRVD